MKHYEYKIESGRELSKSDLNSFGKSGWVLVSAREAYRYDRLGKYREHIYIFVKEVCACWHCGDELEPISKPRCERCPDECDVEDCDAMGCSTESE